MVFIERTERAVDRAARPGSVSRIEFEVEVEAVNKSK
jgi:hypothetical protein